MKHSAIFSAIVVLLAVSCATAPTPTVAPPAMPTATLSAIPTNTATPTLTAIPTNTPTRTATLLPTATPKPVFHWETNFENGYNDFYRAGGGDGSHRFGQFSYAEIVPDPTGSGRGMVFRGVVNGAPPPTPVTPIPGRTLDGNHRAYPDLYFPFKPGPSSMEFDVYIYGDNDLFVPNSSARIHSLGDIFGGSVEGTVIGRGATIPAHVEMNYSRGIYFLRASTQGIRGDSYRDRVPAMIPFPFDTWVRIRAEVTSDRMVRVYQDGILASSVPLHPEALVGTIGGHWGLYATGAIRKLTLLNDNITIDVYPTAP